MGRVSRRDRLPPKEPVILFTFASSLTPSAWDAAGDAVENAPGQAPAHPDKDRETQLVYYIGIARGPSILVDFGRHRKILRSAVSAVLADAPKHCSTYSLGYGRTNLFLSFGQGLIAFAVADDALERCRAFQILSQLRATVIHTLSHTLSPHAPSLPHPRSHSRAALAAANLLRQPPQRPVTAPPSSKCNCVVTVTAPPERTDAPVSTALPAAAQDGETPATSAATPHSTSATSGDTDTIKTDSTNITITTSSSSSSSSNAFPSGRSAKMSRSLSAHFAPTFLADCLEATFKEVVRSARGRLRKRTVLQLYPDAPHAYLVNKKNMHEPDILDPLEAGSNGASSRLVTGTGASEHSSGGSGDNLNRSGREGIGGAGGTGGSFQGGRENLLSSQVSARESLMSELSDMMADFEVGDFGEKLVVSRTGRDDEYVDDDEWYRQTRGQPPMMTTNARGLGIGSGRGLGLGSGAGRGGERGGGGGGGGGGRGGGGGGRGGAGNSPLLGFAAHVRGAGMFPTHSHSAVFAPMGGRSASLGVGATPPMVPAEYAGLVPIRSGGGAAGIGVGMGGGMGGVGGVGTERQQQQQAHAFPRAAMGGVLREAYAEGDAWEQQRERIGAGSGEGSGEAQSGAAAGARRNISLSHTEPSSDLTTVVPDFHLNPNLPGHVAAGRQGAGGGRKLGEGHRRMGGSEGALGALDTTALDGSSIPNSSGFTNCGFGNSGFEGSGFGRSGGEAGTAGVGARGNEGFYPPGGAAGFPPTGFSPAGFSPAGLSPAGFSPVAAGGEIGHSVGNFLFSTSFNASTGGSSSGGIGSVGSSSNPFEEAANRIKSQRSEFDNLFPLQSPAEDIEEDEEFDRTALTGPAGSGGKEYVRAQARHQAREWGTMRMRLKSGQMSPMLKGALSVFRSPTVQEKTTGGMRPATAARISALTAGGGGGVRGDEKWSAGLKPLWASFKKGASGKEKEGGSGKER
ncbi:unnamed protein product [Closterium sp. NIES-64]|nr:unnamed protein product [Closterium sp. NIES-65]CAI5973019.1 unnamed protein product [Closterium sp. NIES-65]CAI5989404.1 unnamed protein product [Closterium sp. NIES-64]